MVRVIRPRHPRTFLEVDRHFVGTAQQHLAIPPGICRRIRLVDRLIGQFRQSGNIVRIINCMDHLTNPIIGVYSCHHAQITTHTDQCLVIGHPLGIVNTRNSLTATADTSRSVKTCFGQRGTVSGRHCRGPICVYSRQQQLLELFVLVRFIRCKVDCDLHIRFRHIKIHVKGYAVAKPVGHMNDLRTCFIDDCHIGIIIRGGFYCQTDHIIVIGLCPDARIILFSIPQIRTVCIFNFGIIPGHCYSAGLVNSRHINTRMIRVGPIWRKVDSHHHVFSRHGLGIAVTIRGVFIQNDISGAVYMCHHTDFHFGLRIGLCPNQLTALQLINVLPVIINCAARTLILHLGGVAGNTAAVHNMEPSGVIAHRILIDQDLYIFTLRLGRNRIGGSDINDTTGSEILSQRAQRLQTADGKLLAVSCPMGIGRGTADYAVICPLHQ